MKTKFNQNAKGVYSHTDGNTYTFSSTMTQLTVFNAPTWVKNSQGRWTAKNFKRHVTVGVARAKDFDFEALLDMAVSPADIEIAVA